MSCRPTLRSFCPCVVAMLMVVLSHQAWSRDFPDVGAVLEAVTPELAKAENLSADIGVIVRSTNPDMPLQKSGIAAGDIIMEVAGARIDGLETLRDVLDRIAGLPDFKIWVVRGTQELEIAVRRAFEEPDDDFGTRSGGLDDFPDGSGYVVRDVYFATNRNKVESTTPANVFGGDRGALTLGVASVTIPRSHLPGELEGPSLLSLEFSQDPNKHIVLAGLKEQDADAFYADLGKRLAETESKSALLFVHGYNVRFEDAARRTAQMAYDLQFKGAPGFFSWPSQGRYLGYPVDEANVEFARTDFRAFLDEFLQRSGAENIYVIAHSMGNRLVTEVLARLFRENAPARARIREIILAAPDVDADVFKRDIIPTLTGPNQSVTLYASSGDWALKASKKWHGYPRAGDSGEHLVVSDALVTIDASEISADLLGHTYFAQATPIVSDIRSILQGRYKPADRKELTPVDSDLGKYWTFAK